MRICCLTVTCEYGDRTIVEWFFIAFQSTYDRQLRTWYDDEDMAEMKHVVAGASSHA